MTVGSKPHLLLLPGLLNDARLWKHQVDNLSDTAVPVVADLGGADSIALLASGALAQIPVKRFVLAGLSMGGYVALEIMRQAPERVQHWRCWIPRPAPIRRKRPGTASA